MTNYVIDAYAWIEYLEGSEKGQAVRKIVENQIDNFHTSSVTYAEVISKFMRSGKNPQIAKDAMHTLSKINNPDHEIAFLAAKIHAEQKQKKSDFGLADAFVIATAKTLSAKIITGDRKHFFDVPNVIII